MIYEYRCKECGQVSEFNMKMSDPHPKDCPRCSKAGSLERVISKTSFALKGSGWYTSDYKRSSKAPSCSSESSGSGCGSGNCDAN